METIVSYNIWWWISSAATGHRGQCKEWNCCFYQGVALHQKTDYLGESKQSQGSCWSWAVWNKLDLLQKGAGPEIRETRAASHAISTTEEQPLALPSTTMAQSCALVLGRSLAPNPSQQMWCLLILDQGADWWGQPALDWLTWGSTGNSLIATTKSSKTKCFCSPAWLSFPVIPSAQKAVEAADHPVAYPRTQHTEMLNEHMGKSQGCSISPLFLFT